MTFYSACLICLVLITTAYAGWQHRSTRHLAQDNASNDGELPKMNSIESTVALNKFKANYLLVFALVMASDWLQGPYLFSLYHDEFVYDLHTIAILFVLGFLSAGLSASYTGEWADRYGRKRICLAFCFIYALSCLTKMFRPLISLAIGRLMGGLATSILFSVFESWLISEAKTKGMSGAELGSFLGRCTLVNGIVAAASGIVSDAVVHYSDTYKSPFVLSGALLLVAAAVIRTSWAENYGGNANEMSTSDQGPGGEEVRPIVKAFTALRENPSLIAVAIAMTGYETSLYLFVFLWVPTMRDASNASKSLPLGTLFSCFMVAMTLGSLIYNGLLAQASPSFSASSNASYRPVNSNPLNSEHDSPNTIGLTQFDAEPVEPTEGMSSAVPLLNSIRWHGKMCAAVFLVAALALAGSMISTGEKARFFSFLLFELTVGLYYPILGTLRSALVPEEIRATLSALFRVPLNLLVMLALVTGMEERREAVLVLSCLMLIGGSVAAWNGIVKRS